MNVKRKTETFAILNMESFYFIVIIECSDESHSLARRKTKQTERERETWEFSCQSKLKHAILFIHFIWQLLVDEHVHLFLLFFLSYSPILYGNHSWQCHMKMTHEIFIWACCECWTCTGSSIIWHKYLFSHNIHYIGLISK